MFFELVDLQEFEFYESANQNLEFVHFDPFMFESILDGNALEYITFKIFKTHNFFESYHVSLEYVVNFSGELKLGYFKENPYHNTAHIIDSMQGLNYLMLNGDVHKHIKRHDIFGVFIACLMHDYEHPGYTN